MKTLIRNGRVVTAVDDYKADILIEDEKVSVIGSSLSMEVDHTIDAAGKLVIPGGIDPHTHMELPFGGTESSDDFRTGTIATAHGAPLTPDRHGRVGPAHHRQPVGRGRLQGHALAGQDRPGLCLFKKA